MCATIHSVGVTKASHMTRVLSLSVTLLGLTVCAAALAQEPVPLKPGESVERELGPNQTHVYTVELVAEAFVLGQANQKSIDVVVTILDPEGSRVDRFDGPARGPEIFSFVGRVPGGYRIEVTPFLDDETGDYAITLERVEPAATTPAGRVDQLFAAWDHPGSPGAAVAIARDGVVLHEAGYGSAQLEYDIPITPSTVFHVASVSKQVTAFAVAMLAAQGRLSLDDDIRRHLPELPDFGDTITIRHLLHHTSGLRDQWTLLAMAGWRLDDVITRDQIMRVVTRQRQLNFEPGDRYLYCNTGYTLLAEIVARTTGQSFPEWTAEHLFEPLGMASTHFHDDHQMIVPNRAYSYASGSSGGYRKSVLSYANAGATSLFTTAPDLIRWMHSLDTGALGGPDVIELMHARGVLNDGDTISYALGLEHGTFRGLPTVGHGGADAGFRSNALRFPGRGLAIAVLSNLASFDAGDMSRRIAEIYLADELADMPDEAPAEEAVDAPAEAPNLDPEILKAYEGEYQLGPGVRLAVRLAGHHLVAQATGQPEVDLEPRSETTFAVPSVGADLAFVRDSDGAVTGLVLRQGGREIEAPRVERFDPATVDLTAYSGVFDSPELETTYELVAQDSVLIARHIRHDPITLTPSGPDRFTSDRWFFGEVRFERAADGSITAMRVSSGRVRNLLFVTRVEGKVLR